jgi:4-alpha-glucanotransferase
MICFGDCGLSSREPSPRGSRSGTFENCVYEVFQIQRHSPSSADTAVIPLQDLLGLGNEARMNLPNSTAGNWS